MTLLVEALRRLKVRLPDGVLHLAPGKPVTLPQEQADKLFTRAAGKVRAVHRGDVITWNSPVLGKVQGEFLGITDDGRIEVHHPITEAVVRIPVEWLTA